MTELKNMVTGIRDDLNRLYDANYTDEERKKWKKTAKPATCTATF